MRGARQRRNPCAIALGLPPWASALIVGLALAAGGTGLARYFAGRLGTVDVTLKETRQSIQETFVWVKTQSNRYGRGRGVERVAVHGRYQGGDRADPGAHRRQVDETGDRLLALFDPTSRLRRARPSTRSRRLSREPGRRSCGAGTTLARSSPRYLRHNDGASRARAEAFLIDSHLYFLLSGALLLFMAVASSLVERLPMTAGLAYLAVGVAIGPHAARLIDVDLQADARLIEHITEIALLFSLFSAGLKLRVALGESRWKAPLRLATAGVAVSVILIAGAAVLVLGVPWPVAVVIAAILSPTDPVLASEVQVTHPDDRDRVRLTLTGEAGLNDGTAFPFLFLGLAMLGAHDVGASAGDGCWSMSYGPAQPASRWGGSSAGAWAASSSI